MRKTLTRSVVSLLCVAAAASAGDGQTVQAPPKTGRLPAEIQVLNLDQCLSIAVQNNRRRPASHFAVAMAEAQHRQALAGYWPQITAKAGWSRLDQPLNFIFPSSMMYIPSQTVSVPGGTAMVNIPANAFGPGFPPATIQMPVSFPGQSVSTNAQLFPIPQQDIKLMDTNSFMGTGNMTWLLFDGGMRKGFREQSSGGVDAAKADARRTDLEITDSVVRLYYGAILARQLHQVGTDTLARMEVTLDLTDSLYKNGAGRVDKTDYLDNLVMVETIRSMVAELDKNQASAEAALAYTMGLAWNATVQPSDKDVPYRPWAGNLDELVSTAYEFNPDWAKLEAGLRAMEGQVTTARSGFFPKLAITGELHRWWNGYTAGMSTAANKTGWTFGVGIEIPVFDGLLTQNKLAEALARVSKLKEEKVLLREGIGLQVREQVLSMGAAAKTYQAADKARTAARENRELTTRAYQNELVDTEKVIRGQLFEALMDAQYLKARYDLVSLQSQLSLVVGTDVLQRLKP